MAVDFRMKVAVMVSERLVYLDAAGVQNISAAVRGRCIDRARGRVRGASRAIVVDETLVPGLQPQWYSEGIHEGSR